MRGLVNGEWHRYLDAEDEARVRAGRGYRGRIPSHRFPTETGRYHLYVSYACPFAHRTILGRRMLGLEQVVSMSVCDPCLGGPNGWWFATPGSPSDFPDATADKVNGSRYLYEVYTLADPDYTGRVTLPTLWDREARTIVNNESADILRFLIDGFEAFADPSVELYPEGLRGEIDALNDFIAPEINEGVYRVGMAASQNDYDAAVARLFAALDQLESRLRDDGPYLTGERRTEADIRLFITLIRIEPAYSGALYCNLRRLSDYPALWDYMGRFHRLEGVAETVKFDQYLRHYYDDDVFINRTRTAAGGYIVPAGPIPFAPILPV